MHKLNGDIFAYIITGYVVVEVLFMLFLTKFGNKISLKKWVYIMVYAMIIRYCSYAIGGNTYAIIGITMLRAITMTLYTYLFLRLTLKVVRPHNLTIALLLVNSVCQLTKVIFLLIGGKVLSNPNNYQLWYLIGAVLATLAIPMYHLIKFKDDQNGAN